MQYIQQAVFYIVTNFEPAHFEMAASVCPACSACRLPMSTGDGTTRPPPNQSPDPSTIDHSLLRPDLYHLDHHRRVVTPVEFTIPDDANIAESVDRKHQKYGPWLRAHPVADSVNNSSNSILETSQRNRGPRCMHCLLYTSPSPRD